MPVHCDPTEIPNRQILPMDSLKDFIGNTRFAFYLLTLWQSIRAFFFGIEIAIETGIVPPCSLVIDNWFAQKLINRLIIDPD